MILFTLVKWKRKRTVEVLGIFCRYHNIQLSDPLNFNFVFNFARFLSLLGLVTLLHVVKGKTWWVFLCVFVQLSKSESFQICSVSKPYCCLVDIEKSQGQDDKVSTCLKYLWDSTNIFGQWVTNSLSNELIYVLPTLRSLGFFCVARNSPK